MPSPAFSRLLAAGDIAAVGRAMAISHDGDRVAARRNTAHAKAEPFEFATTDARLEELAEGEVDLATLPGAYACSTPEIDHLTDLATALDGVIGAQLSGAGLGGCIMVLLRRQAVERLEKVLVEGYYAPRGIAPRIYICHPVQGADVLGS